MGGRRFGQRGFDAGMGRSRYFGTPIEARFDRGAPTGRDGPAEPTFFWMGETWRGVKKSGGIRALVDAP